MKGTILKYGIVFMSVIGSGGILMNISQHVQRAERDIKIYDRKIIREQEAIRVLKAEWAYLNNPSRLEILASKGLGMYSSKSADLVSSLPDDSHNSPVFIPVKPALHHDISYKNGGSR